MALSFGFLTNSFSWLVEHISGGHRHLTHAFLGVTLFTAGALAAGRYQLAGPHATFSHLAFSWHLVPAGLFITLLYASALRALKIGGHHGDLLAMAGAAATIYTGADLIQLTQWHIPLIGLATVLGCAAHIAGDELHPRRLPAAVPGQPARVPPAAPPSGDHDGQACRDLGDLPRRRHRARAGPLARHRSPHLVLNYQNPSAIAWSTMSDHEVSNSPTANVGRRAIGVALAGAAAGFVGAATLTGRGTRAATAAGSPITAELTSYPSGTFNAGSVYWLAPSGDTTGASDVASINALLAAGNVVNLMPGQYYVNAPLSLPPYSVLTGRPAYR